MKKKILAFSLAVLALLPGCRQRQNTPTPSQPEQSGSATAVSVPSATHPSVPEDTTSPSTGEANSDSEVFDTYHSGKPYTPWGTSQTVTLTADSGKTISFTGNMPEEGQGVQLVQWLWWTSTNDLNTSYMFAYIDNDQYQIQSPDTFYEDMGDQFADRVYRGFCIAAKEAEIDIRDSVTAKKNGIEMCRSVGAAQWQFNGKQQNRSFVSYVFAVPGGGYLCCLFQCDKKGWTATQEAAENFVNTFRWEG